MLNVSDEMTPKNTAASKKIADKINQFTPSPPRLPLERSLKMINLPDIDPEILESSKKMMEEKRKKDRRKYLADHRFDIINSILAVAALIVAVIALFFP